MRRVVLAILLLLLLCFPAADARAQLQLARVHGRVVDPAGDPVAGARVALLDALGAAVSETTTGPDGRFELRSIALGTYVLRAAAAPLRAAALPIAIDRALPFSATLQLQPGVSEAVLVSREPAAVSPVARESFSTESLRRVPARIRARALQDAVASLPGWSAEDNGLLHVRGADDGLLFVVDGVPVYERWDALFGLAPDLASVASMNVVTGYVPPEFGLKSGGVIELRSAAGAARWTGAADAGYGTDDAWQGGGSAGGPVGSGAALRTAAGAHGSDRFLDPVHPDNLHNRGGAFRADAQLSLAPGAGDLVSITAGGGRARYDVPHGEEQEAARQHQRQRIEQLFAHGSWQHTWSPRTVSQLSVFHRRSSGALDGSERDTPLFAQATRRQMRSGILASATHARGTHVLKAGFEMSALRLRESFRFAVADHGGALEAGLSEEAAAFDASRPFAFADAAPPRLWSFFVQDSMRVSRRLSLDLGIRFDRATLLVGSSQWSPRIGAAFALDPATVVRASFSRFFQPPQPEYLLLSSSEEARAVSPFTVGSHEGGADVPPERQTAVEAGVERAVGAVARVSATGWLRRVRDAADPNVFFGTTIVFPNSVARGRAHGLDLRLDLRERRGWSGYASYGYAGVVQTGPITGGLFLEDEVEEIGPGVEFVPDHDLRHAAAAGVTWTHARGSWVSAVVRAASGTPLQREDEEDELPNRPGASLVDFETGRVKPRVTVDLAASVPLARARGITIGTEAALLNALDARYAYNFGNPFSGTHFGAPRTGRISLTIAFDSGS